MFSKGINNKKKKKKKKKEGRRWSILCLFPANPLHVFFFWSKQLFKFIVDGEWKCIDEFKAEYDQSGNLNNVLPPV